VVAPIMVLYWYVQKVYKLAALQYKRLDSTTRSPIYNQFSESLGGLSTIRAYAVEPVCEDKNSDIVNTNTRTQFTQRMVERWLSVRLECIGNVVVGVAGLLGVSSAGTGTYAGFIGISLVYGMRVTGMLNWAVRSTTELATQMNCVERILHYVKTVEPEEKENSIEPPVGWPHAGVVEFKKYSMRYRPGLDLVLKEVDCVVEAGEKVGICGRTGSGKSSLMLALFFVISVSAFNPIEHLGCETLLVLATGYDGTQTQCATTTLTGALKCLPAGTEETCKIDQLSKHNDVVVDLNNVAIPDYFLLNILQLVFMIMFNDICMITVAWDNVKDSAMPKKWDLRRLFSLAAVLCSVVTLAQLLYLSMGFAAMLPKEDQPARLNVFWYFGLEEPLQFSEMETMMYISLSWAGFLTLLSCRNEGPFWESLPGVQLCGAFVVSIGATTLIGGLLKADAVSFWACPWAHIAVTLLFNLLMFIVLDFCKVLANHALDRLDGGADWAKLNKLQGWSENRATLARESSRPIEYSTASTHTARAARVRTASASADVDRLLSTVGKLAELVGVLSTEQKPEAKAAVAEILDTIKPIAERNASRSAGSSSAA